MAGNDRDTVLTRLQSSEFDVLVIGGGITGAGVALDAAARGLRVALVERRDFASGTSRWSTKLVHGGIRYLPQFDLALVREALVERGRLLRNAPWLVEPLEFLLPLYRADRRPLGLERVPPPGPLLVGYLDIGLTAYDLLAGRLVIQRHRRLSPEALRQRVPSLRGDGLLGGFAYADARTDDARLVLNVLVTARDHGAVIANYCEVVGFERAGERLRAAQVRDVLTGREFTVAARSF
ncbi:MAG: FAD-dependent oxidoreductase, partial [Thermomicrobium sp.]|nr:FAD-dependent oxidoreductase [Thermomicrobium sp.]